MEQKKTPFFIRFKEAIINFEKYKIFAQEKLSIAMKYTFIIVLLFTLILTIANIFKHNQIWNDTINLNFPEFSFQDNNLVIEGENKKYVKGDDSFEFALVISSDTENIADIQEANDYNLVIALLKDKIILKNESNLQTSISYQEINKTLDLNGFNKKMLEDNKGKIFAVYETILFVSLYISYLLQILFDILLLTIVGLILSKIINIKLTFKAIFSMSVYALTLPTVLYLIYIILNMFTGFYIKVFNLAYDAISYIYIVTAMLMMKTDMAKTQMQLAEVIKVEKEVTGEQEETKKEKPKDKEKEEDKKEEKNNEQEPEGNET